MLDFHNHLMPGVDDGAADIAEARSGLAVLYQQGVRSIITTPHAQASIAFRPPELKAYLDMLYNAWNSLEELAADEFPDLHMERGVEVALDIANPRLDNPLLRLAGTSFALVEFPFMSIPPNSTHAIRELVKQGVKPIIAHPERYSAMSRDFDLIESWRDAGACIQVNCGSLLGYYGTTPERVAWSILSHGWADYLASDYHSRGKCAVEGAGRILRERGGDVQHRALTVTNPQRILLDEPPLAVPALHIEDPPRWKRFIAWR